MILGHTKYLVMSVVKDCYSTWLDLERQVALFFMGIGILAQSQACVPSCQRILHGQIRDDSLFLYWLEEWSTWGCQGAKFPCMFTLAWNPRATARKSWAICKFNSGRCLVGSKGGGSPEYAEGLMHL